MYFIRNLWNPDKITPSCFVKMLSEQQTARCIPMVSKKISEIEQHLSVEIDSIEKVALGHILKENEGSLGDISESISSLNFKSQTVRNALQDFMAKLDVLFGYCEKSNISGATSDEISDAVFQFEATREVRTLYYLKHPSGVNATGYELPGGRFVIQKGSKFIDNQLQPSTGAGNAECRKHLSNNSKINAEGMRELTSNISTLSAAQASSGLLGGNRHASAWVDDQGETFRTLRVEKSTLPLLEQHLKARYPGVTASGRQRWVRGTDAYFLRMRLCENDVNGFTCKIDDTEGLALPVYARQYISVAHDRIFEINFEAIEPYIDKSAKSAQIAFSAPDSQGYSEVSVGGKVTPLRCLGISSSLTDREAA